jgi:hypothetical protein
MRLFFDLNLFTTVLGAWFVAQRCIYDAQRKIEGLARFWASPARMPGYATSSRTFTPNSLSRKAMVFG